MSQPAVYFFGWPSHVGGADTKLAHLLRLLAGRCQMTVVPNQASQLRDDYWRDYCAQVGARCCLLEDLPARLNGTGLSLCNGRFFTDRICEVARQRGLRVVWSGEMMWHHPGEVAAAQSGLIDLVLYVSPLQRDALRSGHGQVPYALTGNYIDPSLFPTRVGPERSGPFTIGRLSRPDPEKYPEDFPVFYEALGLADCRYRVMAWSEALVRKYRWHSFGPEWDLLTAMGEDVPTFLRSLDLFVYPLGHRLVESWGRSVVEAMLSGCVVLAPPGHQFESLFVPGESGFICEDFSDYRQRALQLQNEPDLRWAIARQAREHAEQIHGNAENHRRIWMEVLG